DMVKKIIEGQTPDITSKVSLPPEVARVVRRAMAADLRKRYGWADRLADELAALLASDLGHDPYGANESDVLDLLHKVTASPVDAPAAGGGEIATPRLRVLLPLTPPPAAIASAPVVLPSPGVAPASAVASLPAVTSVPSARAARPVSAPNSAPVSTGASTPAPAPWRGTRRSLDDLIVGDATEDDHHHAGPAAPKAASPGPAAARPVSPSAPPPPRAASPGPAVLRARSPGSVAPRAASPGPAVPRAAAPGPATPRPVSPSPSQSPSPSSGTATPRPVSPSPSGPLSEVGLAAVDPFAVVRRAGVNPVAAWFRDGRPEEALADTGGTPLSDDEAVAAACFERGMALVSDHRFQDAVVYWERAAALDPIRRSYQANLRRLVAQLRDGKDAGATPTPTPHRNLVRDLK
ncbi:MAG: hypothetical protein ABI655_09655, partial [Phenylobacterium sp.]